MGPEESDPDKGSISIESPLGRGVIGKMEGDEFSIKTPSGVKEYLLNKIF